MNISITNTQDSDIHIKNSTLVVCIDIETTGLSIKDDVVIEIASHIYRYDEVQNTFEQCATFQSTINRNLEVDSHVLELTGISQKELSHSPTLIEVQEKWALWLETYCNNEQGNSVYIVGHSIADFDIPILKREGFYLPELYHTIDTNRLSRIVYPLLAAHNLEFLTHELSLDVSGFAHDGANAHRALYDTYVNIQLFIHIISTLTQTLHPLEFIKNVDSEFLHGFASSRLQLHTNDRFSYSPKTVSSQSTSYIIPFGSYKEYKNLHILLSHLLAHYPHELHACLQDLYSISYSKKSSITAEIVLLQSLLIQIVTKSSLTSFPKIHIPIQNQIRLYILIEGYITHTCPDIDVTPESIYKDIELFHVLENIIYEYDLLVTDALSVTKLAMLFELFSLVSNQETTREYITSVMQKIDHFKTCFERIALYGVVNLDQNALSYNDSLKNRYFIEAYESLASELLKVSENMVAQSKYQTHIKNVILQEIESCREYLLSKTIPYCKVWGQYVICRFQKPAIIDIKQYLTNTSPIKLISYISHDDLEELFASTALPIGLHELSYTTGYTPEVKEAYDHVVINSFAQNPEDIQNTVITNNYSETIDVVALNSYKMHKSFDMYFDTFAQSYSVFNAPVFMTARDGSVTKGVQKCIKGDAHVLVIKIRELPFVLSQLYASNKHVQIYSFGNIPIQFAHYWPYIKNANKVRPLMLKSMVCGALYSSII